MTDREFDAIYELLYDAADDIIKEHVLGKYGDSDDVESINELRSHIRGAAIEQLDGIMQRALDDYDVEDLVESLRKDSKMTYVNEQVGEIYWDVEIRRRGNNHLVDSFSSFGTLDDVCYSMDCCLENSERLGDTDWGKLMAIIYANDLKVAVMPNLNDCEYEIVCDIDTNEPLESAA